VALSGVIALIPVVGFWRLYFGPLVVGYVAGLAVLVVRRLIVPLSQTPMWSEFTKGVFRLAGIS
jgi:hypothetical protein